jgi:hypothetical protein
MLRCWECVPPWPLGVRAALAVLAEVVPQEAVEHGCVGDGEVPVDASRGHPPVQRAGCVDVVLDRGVLIWAPLRLFVVRR